MWRVRFRKGSGGLALALGIVVFLGVVLWRRYQSFPLGLDRAAALADAGRFEAAEELLDRLASRERGDDNPAWRAQLACTRASVRLAQGKACFAVQDVGQALERLDEAMGFAPDSEIAREAAALAWREWVNRDPRRAIVLFDLAHPEGVGLSVLEPALGIESAISTRVLERPRFALFEVFPDEYGSGTGTTMADPEAALAQIDLWIGRLAGEGGEDSTVQVRRAGAWAFHISRRIGDWARAREYLRMLDSAADREPILFSPDVTDEGLSDVLMIPAEELEAGAGKDAEVVVTVEMDGKPVEGAVLCLQYVDGSNISSSSRSFHTGLGISSVSNVHFQIIAEGRTDASGRCRFEELDPACYRIIAYLYQKNLDPEWFDYRFSMDGPGDIYATSGSTESRVVTVQRAHVLTLTSPPLGTLLSDAPVEIGWTVLSPAGALPVTGRPVELLFMGRSNPLMSVFFGGRATAGAGDGSMSVDRSLGGFAGLREALERRGETGWDRVHLLEPEFSFADGGSLVCREGERHMICWSGDAAAVQPSMHALEWGMRLIETANPSGGGVGLVESTDAYLSMYPDEFFSGWIRFIRGLAQWRLRQTDGAEEIFQDLLSRPLVQAIVRRAAEKALAELTKGRSEPAMDWRYEYLIR